jgi:hypothetical protein
MLPNDILRHISTFCTVFDSLIMELALDVKLFELSMYKRRLYKEPFESVHNINGRIVNISTFYENDTVNSRVLGCPVPNFTILHKNIMSTRNANRYAFKALYRQSTCIRRRLEMVWGI